MEINAIRYSRYILIPHPKEQTAKNKQSNLNS